MSIMIMKRDEEKMEAFLTGFKGQRPWCWAGMHLDSLNSASKLFSTIGPMNYILLMAIGACLLPLQRGTERKWRHFWLISRVRGLDAEQGYTWTVQIVPPNCSADWIDELHFTHGNRSMCIAITKGDGEKMKAFLTDFKGQRAWH
jgi:hypothetical protein